MEMTSVYVPITKSHEQEDGTLMVYGKATGSDLDLDEQRCDPAWLAKAMPEWFKIGNIREQHDEKKAAGKAVAYDPLEGDHLIKAHVVDPVAVLKTKNEVYTGFSIGIGRPRVEKSVDAPNGVIRGGAIYEISLVDRPALPTATFTMCKAARPGMKNILPGDYDHERQLVKCAVLTDATEVATKSAGPELTISIGERLSPETAEKLEKVNKAAAPDIKKDDGTDFVQAAVDAAMNGGSGCGCCNECICNPGDMDDSDKAAKPRFNKDAAKALVETALAKASADMPPEYGDEQKDIEGAQAAIACIAQLIQSEAAELANRPCELQDIQILTDAVCSLHCFISREQQQAMGGSGDNGLPVLLLSAMADLAKASKEPYGAVAYADPGYQKDGKKRYPLDTKAHAKAAWGYINQEDNADEYSAADLAKVKARIVAACKKFGIDIDDSKKSGEPTVSKTAADESGDVTKTVAGASAETTEVEKSAATETAKAAVVEDAPDNDAMGKALTAFLEKADNPLRKMLEGIESATRSTVEALGDLSARLEKVESTPIPGGPALRRTTSEQKSARVVELTKRLNHYRDLADNLKDADARKGYSGMANDIEAQIAAIQ